MINKKGMKKVLIRKKTETRKYIKTGNEERKKTDELIHKTGKEERKKADELKYKINERRKEENE